MRLILSLSAGALALAGLSACSQSDQAVRASAREGLLLGCRSGDASAQATLNQVGVSVDRFCNCAVDRYMQSASIDELRQLSRNRGGAMPQGLTTAAGQCMTEMMSQAAPAAAPPAASNAAESAAPGEAPAEGAAPAEENTAEH
jgi:hypothetical protein